MAGKYYRSFEHHLKPDPIYGNLDVAKFISCVMHDGKRGTAEKIFYDAVDIMEQRSGQPGVQVFETALNNAKPALEVKSRRVGGATYQVPIEVRPERRTALASRWLISFARGRSEKSMAERLAGEVAARDERLAAAREAHATLEATHAGLATRVEVLVADRDGLSAARERLEGARAELQARVEVLEAEHAGLEAQAAALVAEGDRLRRTLEACQDDLKAREADAVRAAAERDAAQALLARIGKGP